MAKIIKKTETVIKVSVELTIEELGTIAALLGRTTDPYMESEVKGKSHTVKDEHIITKIYDLYDDLNKIYKEVTK